MKYFYKTFYPPARICRIVFYTLVPMKLMTVKEYAAQIGKSIPLVYKQIKNNQVRFQRKFGRLLIEVR